MRRGTHARGKRQRGINNQFLITGFSISSYNLMWQDATTYVSQFRNTVRSPLLSVGLRHETQDDQLLIYLVGVGLHFV